MNDEAYLLSIAKPLSLTLMSSLESKSEAKILKALYSIICGDPLKYMVIHYLFINMSGSILSLESELNLDHTIVFSPTESGEKCPQ
jgi:hypothetical protein